MVSKPLKAPPRLGRGALDLLFTFHVDGLNRSIFIVVCKMTEQVKWAESLRKKLHGGADSIGNLFVETFHYLALFGIGVVTVYAGISTFIDMLQQPKISVDDILLLFIFLELLAMAGIYFRTNHMPLRFLLYIGVTALIRLLISDVSHHNAPDMGILYVCGGVLLLSISILVVRFSSSKYPSVKEKSE